MWQRLLVLTLCQIIAGCECGPSPAERAKAELCVESSEWIGEGDKWQFLIDPKRDRLPFIMMVRTRDAERTTHFMESNILASELHSAKPVGPEYLKKDDAKAAFVKLCQRLGRKPTTECG